MRLRNIKGSKEYIDASPFVIHSPEDYKGKWNSFFKNNNPIHVEIGMGKGQFIHALALQRRAKTDLKNLFFLRFDARYLCNIFEQYELNRIYLNFSDPWPKDRHAKRRLTSPNVLSIYHHILEPEGYIQFKTDNRPLFDFSVEAVQDSELWKINEITYDLHHSEFLEGNIMTEYEDRFVAEGKPICRFVISRSVI